MLSLAFSHPITSVTTVSMFPSPVSELVKTYIPALNTMINLGDLYSETRPDESRAMYAKALSGYTIVRGGSSDVCLYFKRRLDALSISPQQSVTEAGIDTNLTGDNFSNKDKPQNREGKFKKLMQKLKN